MIYLQPFFAADFAAIHLFVGKLHVLDVVSRTRWLSAAGGVAVELSGRQEAFAEALGLSERAAEAWVYLVALAGLAIFHGLERAAKASRGRARKTGGADAVDAEVFWLHIGSFNLYNVLIGYQLLHREETGLWPILIYFHGHGTAFRDQPLWFPHLGFPTDLRIRTLVVDRLGHIIDSLPFPLCDQR